VAIREKAVGKGWGLILSSKLPEGRGIILRRIKIMWGRGT